MKTRKAITPVISIVLLISITVSSVAVLYSQIGEIGIDSSPLAVIEISRNTEIDLRQGYEGENGNLKLIISNTGDRALQFGDEMDLYINEVDYNAYERINDDFNAEDVECLDINLEVDQSTSDTLDTGCDTGLEFPDAFGNRMIIEFRHMESHKTWRYECDVASAQDSTC